MSRQKISIVYAHSKVSPRSGHLWARAGTSYVKNMIAAAVVRQATGWCAGMMSDNFVCILSYQQSFSRSRGGSAHHLFVCQKHHTHLIFLCFCLWMWACSTCDGATQKKCRIKHACSAQLQYSEVVMVFAIIFEAVCSNSVSKYFFWSLVCYAGSRIIFVYLISNWHYFVFVEWIHVSPN